jgi:processive 1,2-diacylglycerol beta-glucosyltransferase
MARSILILYATAGIGHKKASLAVKQALDEIAPKDVKVTVADSLDYTNPFFKWAYLESYLLMVNRLPTFWGLSYYLTDNRFVNIVVSFLRRINNYFNSAALRKYLIETKPDVVVSTHFFASEVIADMKRSGTVTSRLVTVVTDYRLHSWWVAPETDVYVVGGEEARSDLIDKWGTDPSRIKVLGIPVEPIFSKELDREAIRRRMGLRKDIPTILAMSGGFGVGPLIEIVNLINDIPEPVQVLAVCGHNEGLVKRLEGMRPGLTHKLDIYGFIQNVYELMEVSDLIISKSGGITVTESLAKDLPMVVIKPIIGQETRNCDFLLSNGAAVRASDMKELRTILEDIAKHPDRIAKMREAIARIRKPRACYDVARLALEL